MAHLPVTTVPKGPGDAPDSGDPMRMRAGL